MHRRPELPVEDDRLDVASLDLRTKLVELPAPDERAAVRMGPPLEHGPNDSMARGGEEGADLGHVRGQGDEEDVQRLRNGPPGPKGFPVETMGWGPPGPSAFSGPADRVNLK